MAIKVAVFNQKGGVGKTTLSVILTQIALMNKKRVLAVDQDESNNFNLSISYLKNDPNFKDLFSFKTVLTKKDFDSNVEWIIIDCPPALNGFSRFAIKNSDLIVIPVTPDPHNWSAVPFTIIRSAAGDYKQSFQFPVVKVGFTDNVISKEANRKIESLREIGCTVILDVPKYAKIQSNMFYEKWWSVGLKALERQPFEHVYARLSLLHRKLQELRRKNGEWNIDEHPDYIDDPDNPDAVFFGRK